jgi:sulfoxide reductase heme-binding subunit YedZ
MVGPAISAAARKVPTWPVYVLGLVPAVYIFGRALSGAYVEPVRVLEHEYGLLALQFLLASLCVTPLLRYGRVNLMKFRRALGLLSFAYVTLHLLVWVLLDLQLRWHLIGAEIVKRPYLTVGFAAFVLLVPLAATSWNGAMRRMGVAAWRRMHRLVYAAVLLGGVHFVMQEKVWSIESLLYLGAAAVLVGIRLPGMLPAGLARLGGARGGRVRQG